MSQIPRNTATLNLVNVDKALKIIGVLNNPQRQRIIDFLLEYEASGLLDLSIALKIEFNLLRRQVRILEIYNYVLVHSTENGPVFLPNKEFISKVELFIKRFV